MAVNYKKSSKRSLVLAVIFAAVMLVADQVSKYFIVRAFSGYEYPPAVSVIKGIFSITYRTNNGAGFSILEGKTVFLVIFTLLAMLLILYLLASRKFSGYLTDWGFSLVLSGGVGNLIDRVFRGGNVVDFIATDFMDFPVFNVADICVTVGAALVLLYFIFDTVNDIRIKRS